jgi:tetratricopeptide (TPR) repeat protein
LEDAIIAAEESLRLDPTRNLSHYILGVCFMEKGLNEEAIQEFEKFLHYYYDRAYVREYKLKAEEYLSALRSLP